MTSKNFKVATLAAAAFALTALLLVYPAIVSSASAVTSTQNNASSTQSSNSNGATTSSTNSYPGPGWQQQGPPGRGGWGQGGPQSNGGRGFGPGQRVNVTDGETFTVTSTSGGYRVVGSTTENGTASGTITFTVTGSLTAGDTLSISGTVVIGGTTYTISSGSAEMNPSASAISGQGSISPTGEFLLQASAHGSFVGSNGQVSLDLTNGSTEYLVSLTGSVTS